MEGSRRSENAPPGAEGGRETPREKGRRRRRAARWLRRGLGGLVLVLVLVVAALNFTAPGHQLVLDQALGRIQGAFAGELEVGGIRSGGLLAGATLVDVRLGTGDGRPFLSIDSLRARWSLRGLALGEPSLSSVTAWGVRVEISRYTPDQAMTVARLLPPSSPRPDSVAGTPTEIRLGRVRVVDALVEVLNPAPPGAPEGPGVVPSPTGEGRLSRLALDALDLELDRALLTLGGAEPFTAYLVHVSTDVSFLRRPIEIVGAEGPLTFGPRGLTIQDGYFRLPGTVVTGTMELGPRVTEGDSWAFAADLATDGPGALSDLRWIDPRIPDGAFRGGVAVTVGDRVEVGFSDATIELEASDLSLDGGLVLDDGVRLDGLRVGASPLVLSRLEPWLGRELPLQGFLTGTLAFDGPPAALETRGRVTLVPEGLRGGPTTADLTGTFHLGGDPGVTNLEARLDPLNFSLAEAVAPGVVPPGTGRATITASGRLSETVRMVADVSHGTDSLASRIVSRGTLRHAGEEPWTLDVLTDLTPFSLELLSGVAPEAGLQGMLRGSVRTVGPVDSLRVLGTVAVAGGEVEIDAGVNVLAPDSLYRLDAELREVVLSEVAPGLPTPSVWTGRIVAEGRGFRLDSLEARMEVVAAASRIGGLHVDSLEVRGRAGGGLLTVDTLTALLGGVSLRGGGSLGLLGSREGQAHLAVRAESLAGLRPILLGDTVMAGDTLTVLERELLRFEGIDPDTLPDEAEVAMSGRLRADLTVRGSVGSFDVEGDAVLMDGVYGMSRADSAAVTFLARGLPSFSGVMETEVDARGLVVWERSFQEVHGSLAMEDRAGRASAEILREPGEVLTAAGDFALDTLGGGEVGLERARLELDSLAWETTGPSRIAWDRGWVRVQDLEILRPGVDPMRLEARGTLAWEGESDLELDVSGLRPGWLARLLQPREEVELGGAVDLDLTVRGPSTSPVVDGDLRWIQPRYREVTMDSLAGTLSYRERAAQVDLSAWDRRHQAFTARGVVPVDLAFDTAVDRVVAEPMDLRVEADSLAAAGVLSFLGFLEDVEGRVSGEFDIAGTLDAPEPRGVFRLQNAAWTLEALGVRHADVNGSLTLSPDRRVAVELSTRAAGSSSISGTVSLDPLTDPELDLTIEFDRFQAVSRADIAGRISGSLALTGHYRQPLVQGDLRVDEGTLFLEEFARSAEVVDLSDPRILEVVDTTALSTRPILASVRNPFLQKLRVDVDMSVPRDTWLRSSEMNVEMGGELLVTYDRTSRDLVMVGELEALRGSYVVLGRNFEVQGGTVGFIGTPGINPTLDIEAVARIRQLEGGDPLAVTATVNGTLTQPRVQLSSDEAGLAESDLVSYLIFGRPSYELAAGQASWMRGSAGSLLEAAASGGVTYVTGTLANRLGSALAREVGVDYLNITQAGDFAAASGVLSGAQIEVGQYVTEDVFIVLIFRSPTEQGSQNPFGGARIEWALNDPYTVEGFVEDRFLRSGVSGFRDLGFESSRILGVFIFREWGY